MPIPLLCVLNHSQKLHQNFVSCLNYKGIFAHVAASILETGENNFADSTNTHPCLTCFKMLPF